MEQKRRIYLVRPSHEPIEQEAFSSLKKAVEQLDLDISYGALNVRMYRAKKRTGRKLLRLHDKHGQPITIEVKQIT